jgi:hypothetical protein
MCRCRAASPYHIETRADARAALLDISRGVDPKAKREAARDLAQNQARSTFAAVAKEFLDDHVAGQKAAKQVRAIFKNVLIPVFGKRSITAISSDEAARCIKTIAKTRPYQARHAQACLSKLFSWAIGQHAYGLTVSPCADPPKI